MSNLAVLPIVLPLAAAIILAFTHKKIGLSRILARIFSIIYAGFASVLLWRVLTTGSVILELGGWKAPYGIVLVADKLSVLLICTTAIVVIACTFASGFVGKQMEYHYFHAFFYFLITGISGAFLTGDLFNLFVFFEVLLMASYALITLGGKRVQLRESMKYMLINLFSSVLFVTAISFLYSVVGTVNMAQIAERVQDVQQTGILTTIAVLLFFVFATKAALFPLYYWMPNPYITPNPVISALFGALLTKVGIYSILRVFSLIFIYRMDLTHTAFIWIAGLSMLFGIAGALSTHNVKLIIAYNIIPAIGFILLGIGVFNGDSLTGSVYYLTHDMLIKTALFLIVGAIVYVTGTSDLRKMGGLIHTYPLLGWLLFIAAFVLAGIPPFSGFISKLLLLKGAFKNGDTVIIIVSLLTSLLILYSVMRIFIQGFWGEKKDYGPKKKTAFLTGPVILLLAGSIALGIGAELFLPYMQSISDYLLNPSDYINSVLKE
ncbi:Na+/H+ antiporter subunit D [Aciduricibacillus chroicocephali]|uniref:Na+/H+ antiporter subunit D n=1 Tax=Aciduricibacillus chroicocephali TaxID=3054939 RepID=A0ABY9KRV1_9BACI|nr:Na+/H+ antiporter subunit D [Bacillaceae bacterium 44XB]